MRDVRTIATVYRYEFMNPVTGAKAEVECYEPLNARIQKEVEDDLGGECYYKQISCKKYTFKMALNDFCKAASEREELN